MADLNDALLQAVEQEEPGDQLPKRNSKDDMIAKIINCCADNSLVLEHSNTKLRRMNKDQLAKILAGKIEQGIKSQMAAQVGAKANAPDSVIALGALKMIHNIAASTAEKGLNVILPRYGYEIHGFRDSLKDPAVDEAVTQCLLEIAAESDILKHIESPYVRLAIAWGGALVTSIRKAPQRIKKTYVTPMGSQPARQENAVQPWVGRRPQAGKVDSMQPPRVDDEKQV